MEWGNKLNTKKKILVVDDKGMNRYMLGGIFRDNYEMCIRDRSIPEQSGTQ